MARAYDPELWELEEEFDGEWGSSSRYEREAAYSHLGHSLTSPDWLRFMPPLPEDVADLFVANPDYGHEWIERDALRGLGVPEDLISLPSTFNPDFFGLQVSDGRVLKNLELLDPQIIEGIVKLRQLITYYSGAPALGALTTGKGFRAFDAWFQKQLSNECYKSF
jgi:hypothetical protein